MNLTNHKSTLQARGNKNKITIDMDILSTGEKQKAKCGGRRKFLSGGTALGLQLGAAGVNSLINGIAGTINGNRLMKMYNNITRKSTYVPVAREHIDTRVNVEPQLEAIRNAEYRQNRAIDVNTNSSKNALNRKRDLMLTGLEKRQDVNAYKDNAETQLKYAEAQLQKEYNVLDIQNKIADIAAQNKFDAQKTFGQVNAGNAITQAWGNAIGDFLNTSGTAIGDYMNLLYQGLGSNSQELKNLALHDLSSDRHKYKDDGTMRRYHANKLAKEQGYEILEKGKKGYKTTDESGNTKIYKGYKFNPKTGKYEWY